MRYSWFVQYLLALAVLSAACYSPTYGDCQVSCATSLQCPSGLECNGTVCRAPGMTGPCVITGDDASTDAVSRGIPADMLPQAQLDAICGYMVRCGSMEDLPTCRSLFGAFILRSGIFANLVEAIAQNKVIYDGVKAEACFAGYAQAVCYRDAASNAGINAGACFEMFMGTVAANGACALDQECVSKNCNVTQCPNACCMGTCEGGTAPGLRTVGQPCSSADQCVDTYCDETAPTPTCTSYKAPLTACTRNEECGAGYYCVTSSTPPMCRPMSQPGGSCTSLYDCLLVSNVCSNSKCVAGGLTGHPCTENGVTISDCQEQHRCETTCQLPPAVGQPCAATQNCRESYCDGNTCQPYKVNGAACMQLMNGNDCESAYCDSTNMCAARPFCI